MDILNFLGGNGLLLSLGLYLLSFISITEIKDVNEQHTYYKTIFI